jgi:hypothetical protein
MRLPLLVFPLLFLLASCATSFDHSTSPALRSSYSLPWDKSMPPRVLAHGTLEADPDPEWYPYYGKVCDHVNCGQVAQMRVVRCSDQLYVIEPDIGVSTACAVKEGTQ